MLELTKKWEKKWILVAIAIICGVLFFYGKQTKDNEYLKHLATLGGLSYALHNLILLAQ